jgi:hypothetical protein
VRKLKQNIDVTDHVALELKIIISKMFGQALDPGMCVVQTKKATLA